METTELTMVEQMTGRSILDRNFLSNEAESFVCLDAFKSRAVPGLEDIILTFDSTAIERPKFEDLNDIDLLIIPAGVSIFLEICSTPPFCFWGITSSTSLTLGLELKLLNELDFSNVPIHRNKKSGFK